MIHVLACNDYFEINARTSRLSVYPSLWERKERGLCGSWICFPIEYIIIYSSTTLAAGLNLFDVDGTTLYVSSASIFVVGIVSGSIILVELSIVPLSTYTTYLSVFLHTARAGARDPMWKKKRCALTFMRS